MMIQQIVTWASTFVLMLFLPRYLGPIAYGRLFLAASVSDIFRILVTYGGPSLVAKNVSRSRESTPQILVDAIGFRLVFTFLSLVGILVFGYVGGYVEETRILMIIFGLTLIWQGGQTSLFGGYQGHELIKFISIASVTERIFVAAVGVTALLAGADVIIIAIIILAGSLVNFTALAVFAKRIVPRIPRISLRGTIEQLKSGTPYFLFSGLSIIYYRIDSVMLSKMTPEGVVGWYGGAYRLFETLTFVPNILAVVVFPVLSRLWKEEEQTHKRTTNKGLEYIVIAAIPIAIGVILLSKNLVEMFYGLSGYSPSVGVLQVLTLGLLFLYVDIILGTTLLASDRQKSLSVISFCAIPLNIGLNLVLIPIFQEANGNGGIGAAIATGVTELFVMIAYLYLMPPGILQDFRFSVLTKSAISGVFMGGVILLARSAGLPWVGQLALSPFVYFTALFLLKTLEVAENEYIKNLITSSPKALIEKISAVLRGK